MAPQDLAGLIHPFLAVVFVFPLIGIVVNYAWQTRQRRLHSVKGGKSAIPPSVGTEHVRLGRWLSNAVVGVALIGLAYAIFSKLLTAPSEQQNFVRAWLIALFFVMTTVSLVLLNFVRGKVQRAGFATLTGIGLVLIGCQPEVYRRGSEWYVSHYYYGIAASMLMIFALAIIPEIYKDRSNRWRTIHVVLNCFAVLLFIGQGFTGTRDLLEIPLSWQTQHLYKCDFTNRVCPP